MIVRILKNGEERAWDGFVGVHADSEVYLRAGWRRVLERTYDHETRYLVAEDRGEIRGVLPLLVVASSFPGSHVTSLPGGACGSSRRVEATLVETAIDITDEIDGDYLVLRDGCRLWDETLITSDRHCTLVLELPDDPGQLWTDLPSTVRNRVRKARKAGLSVVIGGEEHVDAFYRVFSRNMRDLGTPVFGKALLYNIMAEFGDRTRVLIVRQEERTIGGMFLMRTRNVIHNRWVSSVRDYFDLCPNDLLYWEALRWGCEQGFGRFDLGRSQWGSGTFRFKRKWGAVPQPLTYQYYLRQGEEIPDPTVQLEKDARYRVARWIWQRLPVAVTRVIGPPIVKTMNPLG